MRAFLHLLSAAAGTLCGYLRSMRGSKGNVSCLPLFPDLDRVLVLGQTLLPQLLQLGGVIVLGIFIIQGLEC